MRHVAFNKMNIMNRSGIATISDMDTAAFAELLGKLEDEQE